MHTFIHAAVGLFATIIALSAAAAEIVIGQVAPFSGPLAPTGLHIRAGAQLYFDKINAEGGINGATIKLISRDDGYNAAQTVTLTRELVAQSKPLALFGLVGTGNVEAVIKEKILDAESIPAVGVRTGATSLIAPPQARVSSRRSASAAAMRCWSRYRRRTARRSCA